MKFPWRRPAEREERSAAVIAADNEIDPLGCFLTALRFAGCMSLIWMLMFLAIFLAGAISWLIF